MVVVMALLLGVGLSPAQAAAPVDFQQPKSIPGTDPASRPLPSLPLSTQGRWVVDARGERVKLASANWYGAESPEFVVGGLDKVSIRSVTDWLAGHGFNSIRLPWSNQMLEQNPVVNSQYISANPELKGMHALDVLDRVISTAASDGLMVILDNHRSRADWCCDTAHGDGLWHSIAYPESKWVADWKTMVARYRDQPAVVGAELRNEIRPDPSVSAKSPSWGDGDPATDWKRAAELGGDAVLATNPNLLVVIGGLEYQSNLAPIFTNPAKLTRSDKAVYAGHDYSWYHNTAELSDYNAFSAAMDRRVGGILGRGTPMQAPLYLDEFGSCNGRTCTAAEIAYLSEVTKYLSDTDADWSYWPVNGTQSSGYDRTYGAPENYGLLDDSWQHDGHNEVLALLRGVQRPKQGPGVSEMGNRA